MAELIGFDPLYNSSTIGDFTLGMRAEFDGRAFRFVKTADAVSIVSGMVGEWASATSWVCTVDRVGGSSLGRIPMGVFVGVVTPGNYCWLLIDGIHTGVKDAAGGLSALGLKVIAHATTDGDAAPATAYTDKTVGVVVTVSAAGVAGVKVQLGG